MKGTALAVFGDYCVATASAPPIPSVIHRKHHDRVDAAWHAADESIEDLRP